MIQRTLGRPSSTSNRKPCTALSRSRPSPAILGVEFVCASALRDLGLFLVVGADDEDRAVASIDLKKEYRAHYSGTVGEHVVVDVPARPFLMIDGAGDPNTSGEYSNAIQALYPLAYSLRKAIKDATGDVYVVMPLEGLWWAEDMTQFDPSDKSNWLWTAMISLPEAVTAAMADHVIPTVTATKKLVAGEKARMERFTEGRAAQVVHVGPYSDEGPTIALLHEYIRDVGGVLAGRHHEIYLSDPRKTDPSELRTIIRQPFAHG